MKSFPIAILTLASFALGACSNQYFERKDTIAFSAGDAVAANEAIQIRDPWPRSSQNTNIPMDGVKAELAMRKYRYGQLQSNGGNAAAVGAAAGAGAVAGIAAAVGGAPGANGNGGY